MAKMFITGSARGPSTEEFKARIARLAEMPAHNAAPANARKNRPSKSAFSQGPLKRAQEDAPEEDAPEDDAPETEAESKPEGEADEES